MIRGFRTVFAWLSRRRRAQAAFIFLMSLASAAAEVFAVGAVLPFLSILSDVKAAAQYPVVGPLLAKAGIVEDAAVVQLAAGLLVLSVVGSAVVRLALGWASSRFTQGVGHDLVLRVFSRVLGQPYAFHVSRNSSEIVAGLSKVDVVVSGVFAPFMDVVVAGTVGLAITAGLFLIDPQVTAVAAGMMVLVYVVLSRVSQRELVHNSRVMSQSAGAKVQALLESFGGIRDVLLDGSQRLHVERFALHDMAARHAIVRNNLWSTAPRFVVEAIGMVLVAGLAVFIWFRDGGLAAQLPTLAALALGAQKLLPLFQRVYAGWSSIAGNVGSLEDVAQLADLPVPRASESFPDRRDLPFRRSLELKGLGFRYSSEGDWVFRGLDLTIPRGARVGVIGETGCGKSTLLDILMGLLEPTEGAIVVDGVRLGAEGRRHWQARIAHVPQSIFLTDSTIASNIAFGVPRESVDMARVERAAMQARIHDFVSSLPDSYSTTVGERGVRLSGGQRQRIGIARALYRRAEVLVFDEATSALDGQTEASVMEGVRELGPDVTIFIVAHRLSTLNGCDFVVRMSRAGVVVQNDFVGAG